MTKLQLSRSDWEGTTNTERS